MYTAGTVYTSFGLPNLDYCDTVWSCYGSINADKLEKLQRRAARIVMSLGQRKSAKFLGLRNSGEKTQEPCTQSSQEMLKQPVVHSSLCTILIITRMYCPEEQGTVVNLDSRV